MDNELSRVLIERNTADEEARNTAAAFAFLRGACVQFATRCRKRGESEIADDIDTACDDADDILARGFLEHIKNPLPNGAGS